MVNLHNIATAFSDFVTLNWFQHTILEYSQLFTYWGDMALIMDFLFE